MKIEKSHLLIGAVVLVAGAMLYKRSKKSEEETEEIDDTILEAEVEAEAKESNFSSAEGMPKGYSTDCFRSSQGDTCCYNGSKSDIQCDGVYTLKDAVAYRGGHPVDRVFGMLSKKQAAKHSRPTRRSRVAMSRPERPSAR